MEAYKLLIRLTHLQLAGQDDDGELEWLGGVADWWLVDRLEWKFENV